jgi:flavodoxin
MTPYTGSYNEVVQQGQEEVNRGYRPELKPLNVRPQDYEVIAIGTPTWWYTMAPAVASFIAGHDWTGKTVIPFMTNGGWPGHVIKDMKKACSGAAFANAMQVQFDSTGGNHMETPEADVDAWISGLQQSFKK